MKKAAQLLNDLKQKKYAPIYFLVGEQETFFVDQISKYIEDNVLSEEEKGFNQTILYGRDVSMAEVIEAAKRYPMMAEYQVIIVREAQDLARQIDQLEAYAKQPQHSTILVFNYKYKKPDGRKKGIKAVKKGGVYYETARIYENQVPDWIVQTLAQHQYSIDPKGSSMLVEFLGSNLSKIYKELEKLMQILPQGSRITPEAIEENIGISKDFNNFELTNAIGVKDEVKAFRIINYFVQNPKNNPLPFTVGVLFSYFEKLLIFHSLKDKSNTNVAKQLGVHPFFTKDYFTAGKNYPLKKVSQAIALLRDLDVKSKGVDAGSIPDGDLLKSFLVQVMRG
ncbi:MAG: DNA polymerase III subunit delta [Flavobacteriaceae bacterium]|nr:DNA polymerase III subunit delta [Flavobacteriaceae bacterium]